MDLQSIVKRCIEKDEKARHELYLMFASQMFSLCLRYSSSKMEAEDIFQQAFLKIFEKIGQLKDPLALSGWVKRIFINTAIQHLKEERRKNTFFIEDLSSRDTNIFNDAIESMAIEEITILIQKLPKGRRQIFNLFIIEGFSHKEIAELLDISEGTSKSQLFEARQFLIKSIQKIYAFELVTE